MVGKSANKEISILLIEDNAGDVQLVELYLKDASFKYDLLHAETLFEGIALMKRFEIDIVLLDLSLPDTQGFKTLGKYLEQAAQVPVVVLTGVNNEIIGNQAVKAGAQDFLVKGQFDGKLLGRVLRYSLQRSRDKQKIEADRRELTLNERRISKAQQLVSFGNWEMDIISHEMMWTEEVFRIFGDPFRTPNQVLPNMGLSNYLRMVHIEDRAHVEAFFENAIKNGLLNKIEHRIVITETMTMKWIALHAQAHFEEMTQQVMLVGGVQDITERKLSEQLIMEQNITRQTNLLKEEVLSDLGFHIRTPLSSIVNFLYLMEQSNLPNSQREIVDGLKSSIDDLSLMVNNLLNFSMLVAQDLKLEEETFDPKDFFAAIEKVLRIKSDSAKVHLEFACTGESFDNKMKGDAKKITQIIYNLMDHAVRHTPKGSSIVFDMDVIAAPTVARAAKMQQRDGLRISMTHSGLGLTTDQINELLGDNKILETILPSGHSEDSTFDPFWKDHEKPIGLAIVIKLVKILGGGIRVKNSGTDCSIFEVEFPIRVERVAEVTNGSPNAPVRILLVEDHFLNQMATRKLLVAWSPFVEVDVADNGLIALEKFRAIDYDLILMDLQMPVLNGFDATVRIREKSQVPIVALTASANRSEALRCHEIGMNDYLAKPFKPEALYQIVSKFISQVAKEHTA